MSSSQNTHLSADPLLIEKDKDGTVTIWPGKIDIVWGEDPRYWKKTHDAKEPAELLQVCWLEVTASVDNTFIEPMKKYKVGFVISFTPDAFGWGDNYPIYFMTKRGKNRANWEKIILKKQDVDTGNNTITKEEVVGPLQSSDKDHILFGLYEVWSGKWKGGLKIHKAFVKETKDD